MKDQDKTKAQLISELEELRRRIAEHAAQVIRSQQTEADQQQINDSLPVLVATAGLDGYYKEVNAAFEKILGWSEQESLSRPFMEFIHPDDRAVAMETFSRLRSGEPVTVFLDRNICKDGSHRWINWTVIRLVDRDIVFGIGQDITEKKLADEDLRREHQRAQQYLDVAGVIMVVLDNTGNVRLLNRKGYAVLGYATGDLLGKNWFDTCVPQRIRDEVKSVFRELMAGSVASAEYYDNPVITRSGEERIIAWHNAVLTDDTAAIVGTLSSGLDITERKRAEDNLHQSERTLRTLIDASPESIYLVDADGTILLANQTAARRLKKRIDEVVGQTPHALLPSDLADERLKRVQEVVASGKAVRFEDTRADRHFEIAIHPIRDDQGTVTKVAMLGIDRTDHKRAEKALQKSEELFRKIFEEGPLGVALVGLDVRIQHVNWRFCEMLGYTEEEIIALGIRGITHQQDWEKDRQLGSRLRRGEIPLYTIEKRYVRKDGAVVWGQLTASLMHDAQGKPTLIVGMIEDITERKRAEEALRKSEEHLRRFYESGLLGVIYWQMDGHIVDANDKFLEMVGYERADLAAGRIDWVNMTPPEYRHLDDRSVEELKATGVNKVPFEKEYVRKDGRRVPIIVAGAMLDEERFNGVAFVLDITERKRAEEALKKAHDELERRVEERTTGLSKANEQLKREIEQRRQAEENLTMFRRLAEASNQGFGIAALDGRLIYLNSTLRQIAGLSEDYVGTSVFTAVPEGHRRQLEEEIFPIVLRDGHWVGDWIHPTATGEVTYTLDNIFLIHDVHGNPVYFATVVTDITERKRAEAALERERQSLWRMLQASDHERRIIAYEIHDGLAQYLTGAIMQFEISNRLRDENPSEAAKTYDAGILMARQSLAEARRLISEVRPPIIDENGIETAISHLIHEQHRPGAPKIELHSSVQFDRLPAVLENAIYRITQEALSNACKYSKSKRVKVSLTQEGQEVRLEVQDWGTSFNPDSVEKGHFGLEGIRQRVRLLGGRLKIESTPGAGTLVQVVVPIVEKRDEG